MISSNAMVIAIVKAPPPHLFLTILPKSLSQDTIFNAEFLFIGFNSRTDDYLNLESTETPQVNRLQKRVSVFILDVTLFQGVTPVLHKIWTNLL